MKRIKQWSGPVVTKHNLVTGGLLVVLAAGAVMITMLNRPVLPPTALQSDKSAASPANKKSSAVHKNADTDKNRSTAAPVVAAEPAPPANAACGFLTLAAARQVLGSGAKPGGGGNAADTETADTKVSSCSYANVATEVIILVAHLAQNSMGASANALVFGSEKPSGVTDVPGYGQVAYWDPGKAELNILANNNWYVVSRSRGAPPAPGSLLEAEAVAKAIAPKL